MTQVKRLENLSFRKGRKDKLIEASLGTYVQKLFGNTIVVCATTIGVSVYNFFFPDINYLYGAGAVLGVMILDLITKIFALTRGAGGVIKAFKTRKINSHQFCKGTTNKLVVFGVMLIICGCAYRLTIIDTIAVWFTQLVFTLMFLRDVLSILENLDDAGCDVGLFKKAVRKKMKSVADLDDTDLGTGTGTNAGTDTGTTTEAQPSDTDDGPHV